MKLVTGAILFLAAEQAYAHAHLVQFPNHDVASRVLIPGSLVLSVLAVLMLVWGLLTEARTPAKSAANLPTAPHCKPPNHE